MLPTCDMAQVVFIPQALSQVKDLLVAFLVSLCLTASLALYIVQNQ